MEQAYEAWLAKVDEVLGHWGMPRQKWQQSWQFDFDAEYRAGTEAKQAAARANRFWWYEQNKVLNQHCQRTTNCWLPDRHEGECEPVS